MWGNILMRTNRRGQNGLGWAKKGLVTPCGAWTSPIKKTLKHPRANDGARHAFQQKIKEYQEQGRIIVYIDESGFAHDMPRTYGYSASGQRCMGSCDWQARGRTNVIGALIGKRLVTAGLYQKILMPTHFWNGSKLIYSRNFYYKVLSSWIMQPFINEKIFRMP